MGKADIRNWLSMWANLGDPYVSRACLDDSWEEPVIKFILGRLAKGDVFVDTGANIGWVTLLAAQKIRELGAGHVVSFEPRSELFQEHGAVRARERARSICHAIPNGFG
jgi:hypothetical protein